MSDFAKDTDVLANDSISRQAAIDVLRRKMDKTAKGEIGAFYNTIIRQDIECIEQLQSAERSERMTGCNIEIPEGLRWVPIEEEAPPEDNALVTIKWDENDYEVCEIDFYNWTKTAKEKVTAWMRMPEPYKGGKKK